jgi:hypothetical protein
MTGPRWSMRHLYGTSLGRTGRSSRDSDRIELIVLVPTVACLKPMMAGALGSWSSLVRCSLMRCPALNRRAFGRRGMRYWTSWPIGTATASRKGKTGAPTRLASSSTFRRPAVPR